MKLDGIDFGLRKFSLDFNFSIINVQFSIQHINVINGLFVEDFKDNFIKMLTRLLVVFLTIWFHLIIFYQELQSSCLFVFCVLGLKLEWFILFDFFQGAYFLFK